MTAVQQRPATSASSTGPAVLAPSAAAGPSEADQIRLHGNPDCVDTGHLCCWRVDCRQCGVPLIAHVDVALLRRAVHLELGRHRCAPTLVPAPRSGPRTSR